MHAGMMLGLSSVTRHLYATSMMLAGPLCFKLGVIAPAVAAQELLRPLELALQLGLQQPPLAARTLKALERLEAQSPAALQALAPDLMPLLEPYLAPVRDIVTAALPPSAGNGYELCSHRAGLAAWAAASAQTGGNVYNSRRLSSVSKYVGGLTEWTYS